jgi:hypothetical protein
MQDEILQLDQFALGPERGAGLLRVETGEEPARTGLLRSRSSSLASASSAAESGPISSASASRPRSNAGGGGALSIPGVGFDLKLQRAKA